MSRKLTKSQKESVAARQHFKCAKTITDYSCPLWERENDKGSFGEEKYNIDHIIEVADGGNDDLENLQALCLSCHAVKTKRNKAIRAKNAREIKKSIKINFQNLLDDIEYVITTKNPNGFQISSQLRDANMKEQNAKYNFIFKPSSNPLSSMRGIGVNKIKMKKNINFDKEPIHVSLYDFDSSFTSSMPSMIKENTYEDFKKKFESVLKKKYDVHRESHPAWVKMPGEKVTFILQDIIDKKKIDKLEELSVNIEYVN